MAALSLLVSAAAVAQNGVPQPCNFPPELTAGYTAYDLQRNILVSGMIAFDSKNQRSFFRQDIVGQGVFDRGDALYLYQQDIMYVTSLRAGTCQYGPIPDHKKFTPFGVPANASFNRQANLGISPATFPVNEFGLVIPFGGKTFVYQSQVTASPVGESCAPVNIKTIVTDGITPDGINLIAYDNYDFYNAVAGIENPNVFIPPTGCTPMDVPPLSSSGNCDARLKASCGKAGNKNNRIDCVSADAEIQKVCSLLQIMKFCDP